MAAPVAPPRGMEAAQPVEAQGPQRDATTAGRTLARYKLLEEVGRGGMAVVYRAVDTSLEREVAVKVLHPHLADLDESRARLQREAHAVAKLRHENILEIFDYSGPDSPESYIVTEFIHGQTLKNFLAGHPLPFVEVAEMIVSEVARALEHAHALGVLHRDVKPENVMVRADGLLKLTDFGIAQIVDKERMTVTGQLLGSPAYMAPEHVEGKPLDFRTDVFALGILLYQLSTGQLPFKGKNPHEVLKRIAECRYTAPEVVNPRIGNRLARVIARALAREPEGRFPSVEALRKELIGDLADAGVPDARAELKAFFAAPEEWARAFQPKLVSALAKRGQELERAGRTAAALDLWGRALAVDPKSPELRALVDGVARKKRLLRAVAAAGALVLLGGAGAGAYLGLARLRKNPPKPLVATTQPPPAVTAPPPGATPPRPASHPAVAPVPHGPPRVDARPRPTRPPTDVAPVVGSAPARSIELKPTPMAVTVSLDGKPPVDYDPTRRWELPPGPHTFRLEGECCFAREVEVGPTQAGELPVRLELRPATVTVKAEPPDASITIEGIEALFASGQPIHVPMAASQRRVVVHVTKPGYVTGMRTLTVHPGKAEEPLVVALERAGAPPGP